MQNIKTANIQEIDLRAIFEKYATNVDDQNVPYMSYKNFVQDYIGLIPEAKETDERLALYGSIVDVTLNKKIYFSDFKAFELLLKQPDVLFRVAFRFFDQNRNGKLSLEDVKKILAKTTVHKKYSFDWNCEFIKSSFGKKLEAKLDSNEFGVFLQKLSYEHAKQAFLQKANDQNSVSAEHFVEIMKDLRQQRLTPYMHDNLLEIALSDGAYAEFKVHYSTFQAINLLLDNIEMVKHVFDKVQRRMAPVTQQSEKSHFKIGYQTFLQEAIRLTPLTPMEIAVLYRIVRVIRLSEQNVDADPTASILMERADLNKIAPFEEGMLPQNIAAVNQEDETKLQPRSSTLAILEGAYRFGLATLAGMAGALAIYPIDLVKTRLQNQRSSGAYAGQAMYSGPWDCFKYVYRLEGIRGLYRGLLPQLVGVGPEKALKLVVNDTIRDLVRVDGEVPVWGQLMAGGCAGAAQVCVTNPLEIIKIRLQTATETGETTNVVKVMKELGFKGMYKGASACFARDIPFSFIYFPCYSGLKQSFMKFNIFCGDDGTLNQAGWLIAGMGAGKLIFFLILNIFIWFILSGAPAAWCTTPFDVIKTRLQVREKSNATQYKGLFNCGKTILKEEGVNALFKGGMMRVFRSSPQFEILTKYNFKSLSKILIFCQHFFIRRDFTDLRMASKLWSRLQ